MSVPYMSASDAIKIIQSGDRVFVHGSAATPLFLLKELANQASRLSNVELTAVSTLGQLDITKPEYSEKFYFNSLFVSDNIRANINGNNGEYIPIFLSEISRLFEQGILPIDVAMLHVSPPDQHGYCSLGTSVDVAKSAVKQAKRIIAQVNPNMPRTHGGWIYPHK